MKFECPFCEYSSNRKYNLQSHLDRKHVGMNDPNTGKSNTNSTLSKKNPTFFGINPTLADNNTTLLSTNDTPSGTKPTLSNIDAESSDTGASCQINKCENCGKCFSTKSYLHKHAEICKGIVTNPLQCETCLKVFSSSGAKSRHKKNVKCVKPPETVCQPVEPVVTPTQQYPVTKHTAGGGCICSYCKKEFSRIDNLTRHLMGCRVKRLSDAGDISVANAPTNNTTINNTTNTNCHNTNITNNITINYRSFDKPCIDHIDSDIVKSLYLDNNRNLKRMIKAGVNRIWQTPENNTFELPFKDKPKGLPNSEIMKVHCDGEDQYFPAHHVVDVLLHRCATVCESFLRQHYYDESIPGTGVLKHANVLEELAIEFQETWDEDSTFRNEYKPFVRSAILECLQRRKEREEANSNVD